MLFLHADGMTKEAAKREAVGKDSRPLRYFFARHAKLTQSQNDTVFQIAADARQRLKEEDANAASVLAPWVAQMKTYKPGVGTLPVRPAAALKALDEERDTMLLDHRRQLHDALGDDAFNQLEIYVHGTYGHGKKSVRLNAPPVKGGK